MMDFESPPDRKDWEILETAQIFEDLPPYPWLVPGLHLAPGRITLLNGYADVGKTIVAQSIALAIAAGEPVWGVFEPARAGRVLHLNGEVGSYVVRERYQRMARAMRLDTEAFAQAGRLRLANYPQFALDDSNARDVVTKAIAGHDLVVVDSLRAFSGELDENAKAIGQALLLLGQASTETGCTVLVLHHNRKMSKNDMGGAKQSISGSGSILGGAECAYVMTGTTKGGPVRVQHERSPIGRPIADFGLRVSDIPNGQDWRWGLAVEHLEPEQLLDAEEDQEASKAGRAVEEAAERILEALRAHAGQWMGGREGLRAYTRVKQATFASALGALRSDGRVVFEGSGTKGFYRIGESRAK